MSVGYPITIGELLLAMKAALEGTMAISWVTDVRIRQAVYWYWNPWNPFTVYLSPTGSPETIIASDGDAGRWGDVKFATHKVLIEVVKVIDDPYSEQAIVGWTDESIGITAAASALVDFFENDLLGLNGATQLEGTIPPTCEIPQSGYSVVNAGDDIWLSSAQILYSAQTRPFVRTKDA